MKEKTTKERVLEELSLQNIGDAVDYYDIFEKAIDLTEQLVRKEYEKVPKVTIDNIRKDLKKVWIGSIDDEEFLAEVENLIADAKKELIEEIEKEFWTITLDGDKGINIEESDWENLKKEVKK